MAANLVREYFGRMGWKRFWLMMLGNFILGIGIAMFRWANLGLDPYDGMNIAVAAHLPISYPVYQILFNLFLFAIEVIFAPHMIGLGTLVNSFLLGYINTFFYNLFQKLLGEPSSLPIALIGIILGIVTDSFALSLYQTPNVGVAPYDALALILKERVPKVAYFWWRVLVDATSTLICVLFGGVVGIGTLVCAFGLGPIIHFFNRHFTEKIVTPMDLKGLFSHKGSGKGEKNA